eukprot:CCRYP_013507-RA/>CCRYP_013507-RA protein AED:0.48 eAED:0.59 QI:0/0/0/1/0/0/2/0/59
MTEMYAFLLILENTVLKELEGFSYATTPDLNMGYYKIRLDPDSSKICTLIFPWGKHSYL